MMCFIFFQPETIAPVSAVSPAPVPVTRTVQAVAPPGASVATTVQVPASMRYNPFDVPRTLNIPPGFSMAVYTRVPGARFIVVTPSGDLLVSQPGNGQISLVRPNSTPGGDPLVSVFVSGLKNPHDMVFHVIDNVTYLYVAESTQIDRYIYTYGAAIPGDRQIIIANLPDVSSSELHGVYEHQLKNIALGPDNKLYVSIASRSNAEIDSATGDPQDGSTDPIRGTIYQYNADGTGQHLFARGLRNAEGLAFVPQTDILWVAVNNRDNIACPSASAGSGCTSPGQQVASYINDHPPEEFTSVHDGANFGWPFCNPNPDTASGLEDMPFDLDINNNADGSQLNCANADRVKKGIQAHSAPLGLTFLQDTAFPQLYQAGVALGLHGSWNRTPPTGYKVIYFPWDTTTQLPGTQIDLVTGWLLNDQTNWGRPVDVAIGLDGSMFISDDQSGTVYKMTPDRAAITNVTKATDDGSQGTLSYALTNAQAGDTITFDPVLNTSNWTAPLSLNISSNLPLLKAGVAINGGSCWGGPRVSLDGLTAPGDGLILEGGASLKNLALQGFPSRKLVINRTQGVNMLGPCLIVRS
jgi:glucose/arabinose dehydrogenase